MLNAKHIARALRLVAVVCLLCIPYTDLRVEREPRALGDHAQAEMVAELNRAAVPPALAQLEAEIAATPMQAILRNLNDDGVTVFYLSMTKLVNLNPEVFNVLVDKLPRLAENAELDRLLRQQLKNEYRKSGALYGPKPQALLAKTALQVLMERLDKKEQERLMAARPDLQKQLIEQLLRQRLMEMNQPLMAVQPQNAVRMGADERGMMAGGAPAAPVAQTDKRMGDLARLLGAPKTDTATAAPAKKDEAPRTPDKPFRLPEEKETPAPVAKTPTPAAPMERMAQAPVAPKKSALPPIQNSPAFGGVAGPQPPAGGSGGMMPMQAGYGNSGGTSDGGFAYDVNGGDYGAPARQRFNYLRANPYLSSNGEEGSPAVDGESEIAAGGYSIFSAASGALGGEQSSTPASSGPAFSKPMELTLSGLCASGALNCGNR